MNKKQAISYIRQVLIMKNEYIKNEERTTPLYDLLQDKVYLMKKSEYKELLNVYECLIGGERVD